MSGSAAGVDCVGLIRLNKISLIIIMEKKEEEEVIVGIDLGTTNSLVGVVESGFPIILADEKGRRLLPSVIQFDDSGEVIAVGEEARNSQALRSETTISSVKRFMGRGTSELTPDDWDQSPWKMEDDKNGGLLIAGKSPEQVSAEILRQLKKTAEQALEQEVRRSVITVPAYFNNSQREATKKAGELAGFTVERIINEPTAAALAYGLDKLEDDQTVAVYDLGGGTFDLSILVMREGLFEVISTAGDTRLGGDDIDQVVAEYLRKNMEGLPSDLNAEQTVTLLRAARETKVALSQEEKHTVLLPFFDGKNSYEKQITRARFEELAAPVIDRTRGICRRAFAEAENKGVSKIDRLVLVGGSTRIPMVRDRLKEWFEDIEPDLSQHPDEAIALGAAIQAGMLCGRVRNVVLVDVTPLSLGIETFGGLMNVIIPRNSTIPAKAGELFTNAVANQESMAIRVLQGEREMARDNWLLGEIVIPFQPGPKGSARVGVQFSIDKNGILEVLSRDTLTEEDHILEIQNAAVDVEDEAVEKMIGESIDHAFEDMNERIWTEASMKSEELIPAVAVALKQVGHLLSPEEKSEIEEAAEKVAAIVKGETKDVAALKDANAKLDAATQTLAALLVEQAFGDAMDSQNV